MRLVCPNCDAEYEIDDSAIPRDGRDVQCSNCGHAWFQRHPEVEAEQEAEADLYDAPAAAAPMLDAGVTPPAPDLAPIPAIARTEPAENVPAEVMPAEDAPHEAALAAPVPAASPKARTLDETVLAVLREEAEREAAARRAEAAPKPVIETQTEMPLASDNAGMAAAVRRIARMRGAPEPEPVVAPPAPPKTRSQMLPAIEEINSTLRSTNSRTSDEDSAIVETMTEPGSARGGFRRGFLTLIGLAFVIVLLYVLAPLIKAQVPALAGVVDGYVAAVNAARVALDAGLQSLVTILRGLAGGQDG